MRYLPPAMAAARRRRALIAVLPPLALLALPLAAPLLAGHDGALPWLLDLPVHWQWFGALWLALAGLFAALYADGRWALVLLGLVLPWLSAPPQLPARAETAARTLSIASANVEYLNHDATALRAWLAGVRPDLVVLLEVTPAWLASFGALDDWPYREIAASDGVDGIALLSRLPLGEVRRSHAAGSLARIDARVRLDDGRDIALAAVHLWPPMSAGLHGARDRSLAHGLRALSTSGLPALLIGDLNATPWSPAFAPLQQHGWRRTTSLEPTWPDGPLLALGLPIDHVLASPDWTRIEAAVGPAIGSDHRPVFVRLALSPLPGAAGASLAVPVR